MARDFKKISDLSPQKWIIRRRLDFTLSAEEWEQLEDAVAAIPVTGDRYNAEQQKQVGF